MSIYLQNLDGPVRPKNKQTKKLNLFPEMWMTRKILTRAAANLFFFNRFPRDILFSSLVPFVFFVLVSFVCLFVCLFVWCFLKSKCFFEIMKIFTRPISGNNTTLIFRPMSNHQVIFFTVWLFFSFSSNKHFQGNMTSNWSFGI